MTTALRSRRWSRGCTPCSAQNPVPDVADMFDKEVIDLFWVDFKCFIKKMDMSSNEAHWTNRRCVFRDRHSSSTKKYSELYTRVLGWVACRVTSKLCGIGTCERSFGDVKQIKSGKRSHLRGTSVEKRESCICSPRSMRQGFVE